MRHVQGADAERPAAPREGRWQARGEAGGAAVMRPAFVATAAGASPNYLLVRDRAGLEMVASALEDTALLGLDIETTGLDARADRVRLLSVATDTIDGGTFTYLVDCFAV